MSQNTSRLLSLAGGLLAFFAVLFLVDLVPGKPQVTATAAVAVLMAIWWVAEPIPLAVTALLPVVLFPCLGIMDGKEVSSEYMDWITLLFLGGFMVALAMERWDLHQRIALQVIVRVGTNTRTILLGFMLATAFLSMWISNTATVMMLIPIALALVTRLEKIRPGLADYGKGLFLGIAYSSAIGGISTLVGTAPNLVFLNVYHEHFPDLPDLSFARWMIFVVPFSTMFLFALWRYLIFCFVPSGSSALTGNNFREELKALGPLSREEKWVGLVFLAMALLWITRADLKLGFVDLPGWAGLFAHPGYFNDGTVSICLAMLLFILPAKNGGTVLDWETANKLPWHLVLLFGGGFALAHGFSVSGLSAWCAEQMQNLKGLPVPLVVLLVTLVITFLTELTSNTATAQIFLPLLAILSTSLGIEPLLILVPATLACSFAFMLPVATPPNALVFGTGKIAMRDMARVGLAINLASALALTVYTILFVRYLG